LRKIRRPSASETHVGGIPRSVKSLYRGSRNTIFVIVPRWSLIGSESSIVFVFDIGWNSSGRTQPKIIAHAHLAAAGFDISTRKNVKARVVSQFEFLLPTLCGSSAQSSR
jgi:hypothetical protein